MASDNLTFGIYCMSYQRSDRILTNDCFEYCTYVVRENEADLYRKAGIKDLLVIPIDGRLKCGTKVWNFMTTLWWIIENTPEDVIFVADDDISNFVYRLNDSTPITDEYFKNPKQVTTQEVERIAQMLVDLDLGFACDNPQPALYVYDKEISFKGMPGGIRWINKKALKAKFDPKDWATSDVDMMMQELLANRIILLPKYFHSSSISAVNSGGTTVDSDTNYKFRLAMKNKWGRYYDFDYKRNIARINVKR